jgi:MFS transporter, DHA1 family, inner membrane transport protein
MALEDAASRTAVTPRHCPASQRRFFVPAMLALGILASTMFGGLPEIVGQVARQWGYGEAALGLAVFAEILGAALGALVVAFGVSHRPVRQTIVVTALLAVCANLLTPLASGPAAYAALRLIAGFGAGALTGVALRYLSYTDKPEQHLGLLILGQTLWSVALLGGLLSTLGEWGGAHATFYFVAALSALCIAAACVFGKHEPMAAVSTVVGQVHALPAYLTLLSLFALYVGVGVVWTFAERLGSAANFSHAFIAGTLTAANLLSLGVCIALPRVAHGRGVYRWALAMLAICAASAAALALPASELGFAASVIVFVLAWTGALILIFATIPHFDGVGRHAALSTGFLGVGFGVGSAVGGGLIGAGHSAGALAFASASCVIAWLLYASLLRFRRVADA